MSNPYFEVARTYFERPVSLLQRRPLSILLFFALSIVFIGLIAWHKYVSSQLFLFILLFFYWAIHVKEQFADSRASLTPGFRKIHGVVAVTAGIVIVILLPGVIALMVGRQLLGLISITTSLFGIILWCILRLGPTPIILIWVGWFFTFFEPTRNIVEKIVSGNAPVQAFTIISIGLILSITGIIRLFLLNEDKPEYHLNLKSRIGESRGWRRWFIDKLVAGMIYHARHATDSYWSRMHRWNSLNHYVWPALCYAALFYLFAMLLYFSTGGTFLPGIRIWFATFMPAILVNTLLKEKSHFMVQDLMMPVRRDAYLKQVGMSFATIHFIHWGAFLIVSVLSMLADSTKPSHEFLIISMSYSLMMQIWLYGLAIWINSFRSIILNVLAFLVALLLVTVSFMSAFKPQMTTPWWPLILGALFVCHGLLLTWWGYRRWMVADIN